MWTAADRMRTFTVAPPPESFLQLSQWQWRSRSGASPSSNLTPPQRHVPWSGATGPRLQRLDPYDAPAHRRWIGILPVLLLLCAGTVVAQGRALEAASIIEAWQRTAS